MHLDLTSEQAQALSTLLKQSLPELSYEIAATDNATYRAELIACRAHLADVTKTLSRLLAAQGASPLSKELIRELAHPGG